MDPLEIMNRAGMIDGWMAEGELLWLAQEAMKRQVIVEVGSWKGRSTKALAMGTPGVVYAVDHWKGSESELGDMHKEAVNLGPDGLFEIFKKNLAEEIGSGKCIPVRAESGEAVGILGRLLKGAQADMVFIDGDHIYHAVVRDLQNYNRFVKPGGILCGHDYSVAIPDVIRAVDDLVPNPKIAAGSIWYAIKP